ncbi:hypothetical protein FIA58_009945 [Flavobacterium jejuense]|uniref:Uncharacterized protein n=1 Tax=Flavobacterium jejuense TaxID=1544455 RepID=A0ABX0IW42_9FLAO|nr:hypothetical protein [Flavobacterium jejuense]NHN25995.1 hypothetical protein [Flavobacterium jejuense]
MNHYKFNFYEKKEFVSVIKIEIPKLIEIYDQEIRYYHNYCKKLPKDAPRHIEFREISKLKAKLVEGLTEKVDIDFGNNEDYVSSFSMKIVRKIDFHSIYCKKCEKEYFKNEVCFTDWTTGSGLAASGGKSVFCLNNHFICGFLEWDS